jgi:hypothetical protein
MINGDDMNEEALRRLITDHDTQQQWHNQMVEVMLVADAKYYQKYHNNDNAIWVVTIQGRLYETIVDAVRIVRMTIEMLLLLQVLVLQLILVV